MLATPQSDVLHVKVFDDDSDTPGFTDDPLGHTDIKVADVMAAPSGTVDKSYKLEGIASGTIDLKMEWTDL